MCELITQSSSIALIVERLALKSESGNTTSNARSSALESESLLHEQNNGSIIKPNQLLTAITRVDDRLQCLEVRWGWSPVWSMGTRPPLTHLPLEIVMRSKVFKRMNNSGRALVAVDGWFDVPAGRNPTAPGHFNYLCTRSAEPVFLAAVAQKSDSPSGCNGLVLVTQGGGATAPLQLLALSTESACQWLDPDLDWERARTLATLDPLNGEYFKQTTVSHRHAQKMR